MHPIRYLDKRRLIPLVLGMIGLMAPLSYAGTQASMTPREPGPSQIGYESVADALSSLSTAPGMTRHTSKTGRAEFVDTKNDVVWSSVPANHAGYPAV